MELARSGVEVKKWFAFVLSDGSKRTIQMSDLRTATECARNIARYYGLFLETIYEI